MDDYISRADVLKERQTFAVLGIPDLVDAVLIGDIEAIPAADVRPVVRSKWACGVCRYCGFDWSSVSLIADVPRYCPNCGADMTGGTDG